MKIDKNRINVSPFDTISIILQKGLNTLNSFLCSGVYFREIFYRARTYAAKLRC